MKVTPLQDGTFTVSSGHFVGIVGKSGSGKSTLLNLIGELENPANEPEVIMADEPTGNFDSQTSDEIISLLAELNRNKGLTVLMVAHDQETAGRISDKVLRLKDGMITE